MNDNVIEQNHETQAEIQKDQNAQMVPVRNSLSSGTRMVARGEKGRFVQSRKKLDNEIKSSEKLEREIQQVLDLPALDGDGKPLLDPKTNKPVPLHTAVERNLLQLCATSKDPKILSGASKLLDVLYTRGHGRAKDSPINRDALARSAVQVVIVPTPVGLPIAEDKPKESLKQPSWVKAEVVSENPAKGSDVIDPEE